MKPDGGPQQPHHLLAVCGLDAEARIAAMLPAETVISGADPLQLANQLAALDMERFSLVISFGLCGGLDPALQAGDLLIADAVIAGPDLFETDKHWSNLMRAAVPRAFGGTIAGTDVALADVAAKRQCRDQTGAVAVDMESQVAARACLASGIPFVVMRAISDGADQSLPPLARVALDSQGRLSPGAILRSLIARPSQIMRLPGLARDTGKALTRLREASRLVASALSAG
jgi:hopanoid-associated phosphorylase